jgi:hypothetical protein
MIGSGKAEYAMGIALMARQIGRRERRAVASVLAQFEGGKAVVGRSQRGGRSGSEAEKEALQNEGVDDHNAGQPAPKAPFCWARLLWLDSHRGQSLADTPADIQAAADIN